MLTERDCNLLGNYYKRQELHYLESKSSKPSVPLGALGKVNTFKTSFGSSSACSLPQLSHSCSYIKLLSPKGKHYERKFMINHLVT